MAVDVGVAPIAVGVWGTAVGVFGAGVAVGVGGDVGVSVGSAPSSMVRNGMNEPFTPGGPAAPSPRLSSEVPVGVSMVRQTTPTACASSASRARTSSVTSTSKVSGPVLRSEASVMRPCGRVSTTCAGRSTLTKSLTATLPSPA